MGVPARAGTSARVWCSSARAWGCERARIGVRKRAHLRTRAGTNAHVLVHERERIRARSVLIGAHAHKRAWHHLRTVRRTRHLTTGSARLECAGWCIDLSQPDSDPDQVLHRIRHYSRVSHVGRPKEHEARAHRGTLTRARHRRRSNPARLGSGSDGAQDLALQPG